MNKSSLSSYFLLGISFVAMISSMFFASNAALVINTLPENDVTRDKVSMNLFVCTFCVMASTIAGLSAIATLNESGEDKNDPS